MPFDNNNNRYGLKFRPKQANSAAYPIRAIGPDTSQRFEPLITPEQLVSRFLLGVPLTFPLTGKTLTKEELQDFIDRARNQCELDAQFDVSPVRRRHRLPYSKDIYDEYVYTEIPNKPIISVESFAIVTSDETVVYEFPPEWIDNANFNDGRINIIPFSAGFAEARNFGRESSVGGGFLVLLGIRGDVPVYFEVQCTTGFNIDTGVPYFVNEIVGRQAAIMILNNLIPQFLYSSYSLGLDGTSQSQTTIAPQLYENIRDEYNREYLELVQRVKIMYNNSIIVGLV